ncbi:hypothetical protein WA026_006054 [Henosepilachna vigintioctopunctata]|uniref:Nose resistant-to-fluoxetine protein N-terminal domain-containing protein n=1 Tax=Henosepilachna vigintioctopunctata TaxID=420089 RepID=A0AAW1TQ94_9CUCU
MIRYLFDASTKFPSGIFSGSIYDTGNFDECISVKVPGDDKFSGQHCMAHFKIAPLDAVPLKTDFVNEYEEYERIFNMTTWHKVAKYANDASKQSRDEIFFTFCIPSSCTHEDLEDVLKANFNAMKDYLPLKLEVDVNKMSCRVKREYSFTQADYIFMGVVGAFIVFGVISTVYHLFTKLEALEHYKLSGKAHDVLKAFSYSHIIKKLASESNNEEGLDCVHGIKTISMFLIIMGHRIMFCIGSPIGNSVYVESVSIKYFILFDQNKKFPYLSSLLQLYQRPDYSVMTNGPIIVDTFFTISGFLASYLILQQIDKRKRMINVFFSIFIDY